MHSRTFHLVSCALLVLVTASAVVAGRPDLSRGSAEMRAPGPNFVPLAVPMALYRDEFSDTSGLEEAFRLTTEGGFLRLTPRVVWLQDTFEDFYPGSGVGVDLYVYPGSISLARFSPDVRVNDVVAGTQTQVDAACAVQRSPGDALYLYAVWADGRGGDLDIYFSRSTDGGLTWESSRRLNEQGQAGDQQHPAIAASGDRVHVVWEDAAGVHHTHSPDNGATWQADVLLAAGGSEADIAISTGIPSGVYLLYVAEESAGDTDIFCRRSPDDGGTWTYPENAVLGEPAGSAQHAPSVAPGVGEPPGQGGVWAAWEDDRDGGVNIYAAWRSPTMIWTAVRVDSGPVGTVQSSPVIYLPAGEDLPRCIWEDGRGGTSDLYWARYISATGSWEELGRISGPGAGAHGPAVASFGTATWAAWTAAPLVDFDTAWLRRYSGSSWGDVLLAPDHLPFVDRSGVVAVQADLGGEVVAALWSDDRHDGGDIFVSTSDSNFQATGTYTSTVHDFGDLAAWGIISWTVEGMGSVTVETRSGDTPVPGAAWSPWAAAANGGVVPVPVARYLQYRLTLQQTGGEKSPLVDRVQVEGQPRTGWGLSVPLGQCVASWGEFAFDGDSPPGTTMTLAVLDLTGAPLYSDVVAPLDLSPLSPTQYPRLRLRVSMERPAGNTPRLDWWQLTWGLGENHAAFGFDPQAIYTPTVVQFFNHSTGTVAPSSFLWGFGDGITSTVDDPVHSYALAGDYTVTLTASGECGTDTTAAGLVVRPLPTTAPTAAFALGPLCPGGEVAFTDLSEAAVWWHWSFGDGATSTRQHPTHRYAAAGDYTLTLTVSNTVGSSHVEELLPVRPPPTAAFTWTLRGLTAAFTPTVTGDPTLLWDLGDGYTSTWTWPVHTYPAAGDYVVTLAAANACRQVVVSATVSVCAQPAGLALAYSPWPVQARKPVTFVAVLASGSAPLTYTWDFGDGTTPAHGSRVEHTYSEPGTYDVAVEVGNRCGSLRGQFPLEVGVPVFQVFLPLAGRGLYGGDAFEPDDTAGQARELPLGSPQRHTFGPEGDMDWGYLLLTAGTLYRFQTRELTDGADTRLWLYRNGQYGSPVASNDDWGSGDCGGSPADPLSSCLLYTPAASGRYDLLVDQYPAGAVWGPAVGYVLLVDTP